MATGFGINVLSAVLSVMGARKAQREQALEPHTYPCSITPPPAPFWMDMEVDTFNSATDTVTIEDQNPSFVTVCARRRDGDTLYVMLSNRTRLILRGALDFPDQSLRVIRAHYESHTYH